MGSEMCIRDSTYSHLLEDVGRDAAERAAALVPRARRAHSVPTQPESAGTTPREEVDNSSSEHVLGVGPRGIEPRTRGLKVRCSAD